MSWKKFLASFCAFFFVASFLTSPAYGATIDTTINSHAQARDDFEQDPNANGMAVLLMDSTIIDYAACKTFGKGCSNVLGDQTSYYQKSLFGQVNSAISMMYKNQPANLAYWFRDTGESLGFIPKTSYAQNRGVGFNGLLPLLDLWKIFRNIAYMGLSIMMVFVGFMVMFRRKIDPKTVVTVQNALPRIIVALIAITFSYAIVAFLIEVMYIIMFASVSFIGTALPNNQGKSLVDAYVVGGGSTLWDNLFGSVSSLNIDGTVSTDVWGWVKAFIDNAGAVITNILLWVIFAIALMFTFFRLFFMLITAYIQVLVALIIGPIQILADVIPGTNALQNWLVGLVGNLSTFALTAILMLVNKVVIDHLGTSGLWSPPYIGGLEPNILKAFLGCGMMIMIPNLVNSLKQAIKANAVIPLSMGSALAPVTGTVGSAMGLAQQFSMIAHGPIGGLFKRRKG